MSTYDTIKKLCDERGIAVTVLEKELGFGRGSIGKLKTGNTSAIRLQQIANYFGVPVNYLLGSTEEETNTHEPTLNARDQRDIAKRLKETLDDLTNNTDGLMFDGEPLDEETKELLRISLQNQLEMTKLMAKKKYTPKKYQK